jgi:hypothetical protein
MALEHKTCQGGQSSYLFDCFQESSQLAEQLIQTARLHNQEFLLPHAGDSVKFKVAPGSKSSDGYDDLEEEEVDHRYDWDDEPLSPQTVNTLVAPALVRGIATGVHTQDMGNMLSHINSVDYAGFKSLGPHHVLVNNDYMLLNTWIKYYYDTNTSERYLKRRCDEKMVIMSGTATGITQYSDGSCSVSFNSYFVGQSITFCDEVAIMHMIARRKSPPHGNILSVKYFENDNACCIEMERFPKSPVCKETVITYNNTVYFWPSLCKNRFGKSITWNVCLDLPFGLIN